ncbi:hypothetical protein SCLCIDRAFT_1210858 [Scleroderma citrinum Foug A]|uniref:Yeast cell wall synthesis Kre9/Knh1-like N-terminal domain-containing protein n=1 Tax=Scleroderma citrinum Foug A TaxID=1036808 RepID=A0A0C2ZZG3_9AGAM|nr:hypothetical protein SCLCIDRAFT_1210858 [Scleroderma citrinum Foug A]
MFTSLIFSLVSFVSCVFAVPVAVRDVVAPPITSPTAGVVWHVGETQTVTWSTASLPVNITNPNGMLVLGYLFNNSENLMLSSPLATNINYANGEVQITVPNVPTRNDYIVVLFGDSGNASPQFTIINDSSSSGTPTISAPPANGTPTSPASPSGSTPSGPSNGGPTSNAGSPQGSPSGSSMSVTSTPTVPPASGTSSTTTSSTAHTTTSTPSTQINSAGLKYSPSSRYGLSLCLVLTSLVFIL